MQTQPLELVRTGQTPAESFVAKPVEPKLLTLINALELEIIHFRNTGIGKQFLRAKLIETLHKVDGTTSTFYA